MKTNYDEFVKEFTSATTDEHSEILRNFYELKSNLEAIEAYIKSYLMANMESWEDTRVYNSGFKVVKVKSQRLVISDIKKVPDSVVKVKRELDTKKVKQYEEENGVLPEGVGTVESTYLKMGMTKSDE